MTACGASFAVSSPAVGLMSKIAPLQPSSARRSVSPRPIPCPPPVTTATFPDRPFNADLPCRLSVLSWRMPPECGNAVGTGIPAWRRACSSLWRRPVLLQRKSVLRIHLPGDDRLHDLDRTAGDLDYPRIGIGPGDRIFPHVAPAAEQLQTFVDCFAVKLGGEHFGHRCIDGIELALHEQRDASVGKDACNSGLGLEIGQLELGVLEIGDLLTERASLGSILQRPIDDRFGDRGGGEGLAGAPLGRLGIHLRRPFAPAWLSVLVASTTKSQSWPLEINTFCPFMTKSSPSRTARVRIAFRSLPA